MSRYSQKRTMPTAIIVIVVIVIIVTLVAIIRSVLFSGGGDSTHELTVQEKNQKSLLSLAVDHQVRMTVRGPIVADENFNSYQITVTPTSRSLVTYSGYLDRQIERVDLKNNTPAYEEFVNALDKANFAKGEPLDESEDDTLGICATGLVYEFNVADDEGAVVHLWTSTCKGSKGSLNASVQQLTNLFIKQIPDAKKYIKNLNV